MLTAVVLPTETRPVAVSIVMFESVGLVWNL
ncbi:unannotated protein [freshwater metagenome]|uniref:Unannotated protein n=1 Tax=freshwater metagenome TaxID=449393 RepID=A0A6J7R182_9ZZZZ